MGMKMGMKKVLFSALVLTTITSTASFAQASTKTSNDSVYQSAVKNNVEGFVKNAYDHYYTINSLKLNIKNYSLQNNLLTAQVDISLTKTLKAKSVDDLPYVKGLKNKLSYMKSNKDAYASDADRMVSEKTKELGAYIGTAQEQNDSFRITANVVNGTIDFNHSKLEKLNYIDWVPATAFIPETEATITKHGEEDLTTLTVNNKKALNTQAAAATFSPQSIIIQYDRLVARDYANTYTSEVTSSPWYDTTHWNKGYAWHLDVDCANYVSQAISAGGIPVDSTWAPETTAWINTGRNMTGLKQYMVDTKGYFYKTTQTAVSAGGWIFDTAPNSSHVMFVVANDGITMLFSAHTNDRKQASFANFGTQYEYYYISSSYAIN